MASSDVDLGRGIAAIVRDPESLEAEAASQLLAETLIWYRAHLRTKVRVQDPTPDPNSEDGKSEAERAYYAARAMAEKG